MITEKLKLFMVVERFRDQNAKAVYGRFREKGRMMPDGLAFVDSGVTADLSRCFQVMECSDIAVLQQLDCRMVDLTSLRFFRSYGARTPQPPCIQTETLPNGVVLMCDVYGNYVDYDDYLSHLVGLATRDVAEQTSTGALVKINPRGRGSG